MNEVSGESTSKNSCAILSRKLVNTLFEWTKGKHGTRMENPVFVLDSEEISRLLQVSGKNIDQLETLASKYRQLKKYYFSRKRLTEIVNLNRNDPNSIENVFLRIFRHHLSENIAREYINASYGLISLSEHEKINTLRCIENTIKKMILVLESCAPLQIPPADIQPQTDTLRNNNENTELAPENFPLDMIEDIPQLQINKTCGRKKKGEEFPEHNPKIVRRLNIECDSISLEPIQTETQISQDDGGNSPTIWFFGNSSHSSQESGKF